MRCQMLSATVVLFVLACASAQPSPSSPQAQQAVPSAERAQEPGVAWATFIRDDCEWSGPEPSARCFGNRGPGFRLRAIRAEGARWYMWDPSTDNFAYVSRNALSLPAELTRDDDPGGPPARAVVTCIDRSSSYRFGLQGREAIAKWIRDIAHAGDVFSERWIEENSYRPEAESVPAIRVPPDPTRIPAAATTPGSVESVRPRPGRGDGRSLGRRAVGVSHLVGIDAPIGVGSSEVV